MFKRYWLVELYASNPVKSVRSNCVLEGGMFSLPPLHLVYENCLNLGYPSINVLSVTRIGKKSADMIKKHINGTEKYQNQLIKEVADKFNELKGQTPKAAGSNPSL